MKCQILLSVKNKKNISKYHLMKFLSSMLNVNNLQFDRTLFPSLSYYDV